MSDYEGRAIGFPGGFLEYETHQPRPWGHTRAEAAIFKCETGPAVYLGFFAGWSRGSSLGS